MNYNYSTIYYQELCQPMDADKNDSLPRIDQLRNSQMDGAEAVNYIYQDQPMLPPTPFPPPELISRNMRNPMLEDKSTRQIELDQAIKQKIDSDVAKLYEEYNHLKQGLNQSCNLDEVKEHQYIISLQRSIKEVYENILERFRDMPIELSAHLDYLGKFALLITRQPSSFVLCDRKESEIEVVLLISPDLMTTTTNQFSVSLINENEMQTEIVLFANNDKERHCVKNTKQNKRLSSNVFERVKDKFGNCYFVMNRSWKIVGKKPIRIGKSSEESTVLAENFYLHFRCEVDLLGYGKIVFEKFSIPSKVLTNISQKDRAMKIIVWEKASEPYENLNKFEKKPISKQVVFGKLMESIRVLVERETKRGVTENDVLLIGQKFFGNELELESTLTFDQYNGYKIHLEDGLTAEYHFEEEPKKRTRKSKKKQSEPGPSSAITNPKNCISFIEWFLILIKFLTKEVEVSQLWEKGEMYGYVSTEECRQEIFSARKIGMYIIRLSLSTPVAVCIDWVLQNGEISSLRWPLTNKKQLLSSLREGFQDDTWIEFKSYGYEVDSERQQYRNNQQLRKYVPKTVKIKMKCEFVWEDQCCDRESSQPCQVDAVEDFLRLI